MLWHEHDLYGSVSDGVRCLSAQGHSDSADPEAQAGPADQYVWRCWNDDRVRATHRANDGRVFSRDDPPDTSHPGEDYNCRCEAVPYMPGETEFASHEFTSGFPPSSVRWVDLDFVFHYCFGGGRAVTLDEIGHLRGIAEQ
ncbi:phage minor head protein [Paracoccus versutus]|uniref:phage minor head protein n=1 Tax=Paracoccus versutus TaxID=34007 RepID=UPI001FB7E9E4|nr:phage minor head protein [Paracoccus versutus]